MHCFFVDSRRASYGVGTPESTRSVLAKAKNSPPEFEFTTFSRQPGRSGDANSPFLSLVFGINKLRSGEMPYFCAKSRCSGAFVQLLCNQNFNGLPCRRAPITSVKDGESCGFAIF